MKFYDRENELSILKKNWEASASHSFMTTVIGRRRTGKTSLLIKSVESMPHLYLYVTKDNEQMLCRKFQKQATESLGIEFYGQTNSINELFDALMRFGKNHHYTLIIDEFQNFLYINKSIPSSIQEIWDKQKDTTHVNLIICGSIFSMMRRIFENGDEPLYGRRDSHIRINPFSISILKKILEDHNEHYTSDDLLCLYMLTGGVAKYVALLMDAKAVNQKKMIDYVFSADSPFLTEGSELLTSEFGRDYGTYFSIMQLIALGMTTQSQIDSVIGKNTGSYLNNLHNDYHFISRNTPILSRHGQRNIKWQVDDPFLRFWFRFVYPYQGLIESNQTLTLKKHMTDEYTQFSGKTLERFFQQKALECGLYTQVGNWWDKKGENEIDMVAINEFDKRCMVAEIKRNYKKINLQELERKTMSLPKEFSQYNIEIKGLSLEDM